MSARTCRAWTAGAEMLVRGRLSATILNELTVAVISGFGK